MTIRPHRHSWLKWRNSEWFVCIFRSYLWEILEYKILLKVLLDAATSESMIRFELDGTLVMRKKSEAMIRNVSIIVDLLLHWRIWEGYDEDILVMIFHALASLVRHDHPHQGLNLKQFHSVNLINVIFKIYQVGYIYRLQFYC